MAKEARLEETKPAEAMPVDDPNKNVPNWNLPYWSQLKAMWKVQALDHRWAFCPVCKHAVKAKPRAYKEGDETFLKAVISKEATCPYEPRHSLAGLETE